MTDCFADTAYFLALVNPDDDAHAAAMESTRDLSGTITTTSAVLNELGNHLCEPVNRPLFLETLALLQSNSRARIVHVDERIFAAGIDLFRARQDQKWSLTDCISFIVMRAGKIEAALTTDHHFQQAGFVVLLKK